MKANREGKGRFPLLLGRGGPITTFGSGHSLPASWGGFHLGSTALSTHFAVLPFPICAHNLAWWENLELCGMDNTSIPFLRVPGCIQRATTPLLCRMPHTRAWGSCQGMSADVPTPAQSLAKSRGDGGCFRQQQGLCWHRASQHSPHITPVVCSGYVPRWRWWERCAACDSALLRVSCQSFRLRAVIKKLKEEKIYHFPEENCSSNAH